METNEQKIAIAVVDVGGTKIAGAVALYDTENPGAPQLVCRNTVPTDAQRGGDAVLETILSLVDDLVCTSPIPVSAIGVGTAGRVDARTGNIAYANEIMPGWSGQPLGDALRSRTDLPVAVMNDVQAHALGEARWGAGTGARTCLVIAVGTGLGGVIIAHGQLVRGYHGFAGELGAVASPLNLSRFGESDSLESVAAGSGIAIWPQAAKTSPAQKSPSELPTANRSHDRLSNKRATRWAFRWPTSPRCWIRSLLSCRAPSPKRASSGATPLSAHTANALPPF